MREEVLNKKIDRKSNSHCDWEWSKFCNGPNREKKWFSWSGCSLLFIIQFLWPCSVI